VSDRIDPEDRLPLSEAGDWARNKHRLLEEYIDSAWGARRQWSKYGRCAYLDLFSGPGRQYIEESNSVINGSPLVAWVASKLNPAPFQDIYISDKRAYAMACEKRLKTLGAPVTVAALDAAQAAQVAARNLDPKGLHLVFVDPYGLTQLEWKLFQPLLQFRHIDFMVHFSAQGLTRNLYRFFDMDPSPLDSIAPGWRTAVPEGGKEVMRGQFFEYWISLFTREGFKPPKSIPLIVADNGAPLYRLVLFSRNKLGEKLWNSVSRDVSQPELPF
jgi:three-Cys-motif partner protein